MITRIEVENFKSLKKVSLDLKQINLLIGANNSGKSNLLRALEFVSKYFAIINEGINFDIIETEFKKLSDTKFNKSKGNADFIFITIVNESNELFDVFSIGIAEEFNVGYVFFGTTNNIENINLFNIDSTFEKFDSFRYLIPKLIESTFKFENQQVLKKSIENGSPYNLILDKGEKKELNLSNWHNPELSKLKHREKLFKEIFNKLIVYKPDPNKMLQPGPTTGDDFVKADVSNIVSFFDRMKDINIEVITEINKDLHNCISEFKDIRLDTVNSPELLEQYKRTIKKFGVSDVKGNIFWAEEMSEGALYFIAILAIIHQPNPPKLLLLEEPEKGIHPRRISEIITYLQALAKSKGIQIILTSHSPIVLDQFAHDPSSVFVFDKDEEGASLIRNLEKDIIFPKLKTLKSKGIEPLDYTENLGENWQLGIINGIPND